MSGGLQEYIFIIVMIILSLILLRRFPRMSKIVFFLYILGFLYFTFLTREPRLTATITLSLFHKIRRAVNVEMGLSNFLKLLFTGRVAAAMESVNIEWKQIGWEPILNILLFIPMGFLIPYMHWFKHAWKVILFGLMASLIVETIQLVTKLGFFDIDDLINNTVGTVIGYVLWLKFLRKPD